MIGQISDEQTQQLMGVQDWELHSITEPEVLKQLDSSLEGLYGKIHKGFDLPSNKILYNFPTYEEANLAQFYQHQRTAGEKQIRKV